MEEKQTGYRWIKGILEFIDTQEDHGRKANWLFQTKNPGAINENVLPKDSVVCTTIETNRWYPDIMNNAPSPYQREMGMQSINLKKYVTIEPIMNFDLNQMVEMIRSIGPEQVNIGADSGNNKLIEPSREKIMSLIGELNLFTNIKIKKNLNRIIK